MESFLSLDDANYSACTGCPATPLRGLAMPAPRLVGYEQRPPCGQAVAERNDAQIA
jgi:hypothetical protein